MPLTLIHASYMTLRKWFVPLIFSNTNYLTEPKTEYVNIGDSIYD